MAETGNIEDLAKIVSEDIFKYFKWNTCLPKDENWECELEHHKKKSHPSDVVFYYEDPYTGTTKYINTDLKSYGAGSISKDKITSALKSLSMSVECANISQSWQQKFIVNDRNFGDVSGLLFIYNHDDDYHRNFSNEFSKVESSSINVAESNQIVVFGPDRINRLLNIVTDIKGLRADDTLPPIENYTFFYPDLIRSRRNGNEWNKAATIEALTSPWLILKYRMPKDRHEGFLIYYNDRGETVDEFIYLIDAISHYQMLLSDHPIKIRLTNSSSLAAVNFNRAKDEYLRMWGNDSARQEQMNRLEVRTITTFTRQFNPMEIGMNLK